MSNNEDETVKLLSECFEYLYSRRAKNLPPTALADFFDRLIWCLDDNGAEISGIQREWLKSDDPDKVEIALSMTEVCPFDTQSELAKQLKAILLKFPALKDRCEKMAERWNLPANG